MIKTCISQAAKYFSFNHQILILIFIFQNQSSAAGIFGMAGQWRQKNVEVAWLGGAGQPSGGFVSGLGANGGSGDGLMLGPMESVTDGSGNLYVVDFANYRIVKFNSTGVFIGWIGNIATSPTGGAAGCAGAAVSTFTPGWCTGGTAKLGTGDGMMNTPRSVFIDASGNMFVSDQANHRINKYNSATGAFLGWIGKINTSPTGGAVGCSGAAVGTFTPGWCTGGTSTSGSGDGMMNQPKHVNVDGSDNLFVVDSSNHRISKYTASSGAFVGWIGNIGTSPTGGAAGCAGATAGTFTLGWCTGGTGASGSGDGMLNGPTGAYLDGTSLYVLDSVNYRVSRYMTATGAFIGWIGNIATSPTGGAAGCAGAAVSTFTPGWCTGGTGKTGSTGNGSFGQSFNLFVDSSDHLYLADYYNARISKYTASTGAFIGWIGEIGSSPTGGAAGCAGAAVYTVTPGWCTGGTSTWDSGDGMMYSPAGVYVDASGNLLVADYDNSRITKYDASTGSFIGSLGAVAVAKAWTTDSTLSTASALKDGVFSYPISTHGRGIYLYVADANSRINRFNKATGAFAGWIGRIGTSPTGGDAGCAGAAVGTFTPGWCTGGSSTRGTADGNLWSPYGVFVDAGGNLYAAEYGYGRVSKFNAATGAFLGWIGKIGTSPTGGAVGCAGAAVGTFTPGWCTGGTSASGTGDGHLNNPRGIAVDGSDNLYISDRTNNRISKYVASTGAFIGWIGKIGTSPTGGAAGCAGAAVGTFTPGWCTGGTGAAGSGDGMMNEAQSVSIDGAGNMYVADHVNPRVLKFNASTGAFIGWIGNIATSPTGGAAGCAGAAAGTATPGWCTGGTAVLGTGDGMFKSLEHLYVDSVGELFVADFTSSRVSRINAATGKFLGWMGGISAIPTGGAASCNGAAVNSTTPGWCTGGVSKSAFGFGTIYNATGIFSDGDGTVYVCDFNGQRVTRYRSKKP